MLDYSNTNDDGRGNHRLVIKRAAYYRAAQIDQSLVWRYEALEEMRRWLTYGPWIADWESYEETNQQEEAT